KLGGAASWIYLRTARIQLAHARSDSAVLPRGGRGRARRASGSTAALPGVSQWRGLVVDTLVALDEINEAADHVARLDQLAATAQNLSAGAEAAVARAVLLAGTGGGLGAVAAGGAPGEDRRRGGRRRELHPGGEGLSGRQDAVRGGTRPAALGERV